MSDHSVGPADSFLKNGEMKRLDVDGTAVLLARVEDQYYAVGANCTHYGGPLEQGALCDYTVMCPLHHACFDIRTAARLEPPALNDLPHFPVHITSGQVVVTLPEDNQAEPQGKADSSDSRTLVIVGGGGAGNAAAEEFRREGFRGKIIMVSAAPDVPVDRPNVSKDYLAGHADPAWMPLRGDASWYAARDIDLRLNSTVDTIDSKAQTVHLKGGETIHYDKLLLATGGIPRQLQNTPGTDLKEVFLLRTMADADAIIAAVEKAKNAVVIGASFIGMEGAASLAARKLGVTVVGLEDVPFSIALGREIGQMFRTEHEANGIQFRLSSGVKQIVGKEGHVSGVELKTGEILPADLVVVGVGVRPATDFLGDSGLKMDDWDHSVHVNAMLQTSNPNIYAAGDIARYDNESGSDRGTRIEHWRAAEQQGIVAARNILGGSERMSKHIPFFWTTQWGLTVNYVGHAEKWDEIIYRGSPAAKDFIAFFVAGGKLLAAAGCGHDTEMTAIEFIMRNNRPLSAAQMRDSDFNLMEYMQAS